jgi:uncharacterized protein YdeI (YjbR/CyaY-like superfamily)
MEISKTLIISTRQAWRDWLRKHYKTEKEIWLVYPRKATGKTRLYYNDAVEEALCFGWIDSSVNRSDTDLVTQRVIPRNPEIPSFW